MFFTYGKELDTTGLIYDAPTEKVLPVQDLKVKKKNS